MDTSFRLFLGSRPATVEELRRVEEIVVEQTMDKIWEARIRFSLCMDDRGRWQHQTHELVEPFSRVRVEIKTGDKSFVPLIDGPVAAFDQGIDSRPARSTTTVVIRDDGVRLNRLDVNQPYRQKTDRQIVEQVFGRNDTVVDRSPEIQTPRDDSVRDAFQRGTDLVFLRQLGQPYHFHAYVLPTAVIGTSKGYFRGDPREASPDHPPLVLTGNERNLVSASITDDLESPERTRARSLRFGDQEIVSGDTNYSDVTLMRELPAVPEDVSAIRNMRPQDQTREDPSGPAHGQQARRSQSIKLTAQVLTCYPAVLTPYIKVPLHAGDTPYSGTWLIRKVTHRITTSVYVQEFEAALDSRSNTSNPAPPSGGPGLSLSFSTSLSIL